MDQAQILMRKVGKISRQLFKANDDYENDDYENSMITNTLNLPQILINIYPEKLTFRDQSILR